MMKQTQQTEKGNSKKVVIHKRLLAILLLALFGLSGYPADAALLGPDQTQASGPADAIAQEGDDVSPPEEPQPAAEAAPINTTKGEPIFDPATIVLEKITLAPEPVAFIPVDNIVEAATFDNGIWTDGAGTGENPISLSYSKRFASEGELSLQITAPIIPSAEAGQNPILNTARLNKRIVEPGPWIESSFVTVDVYVQERITQMPELLLTLENSAGEIVTLAPVNIDRLRQWDNRQVTFPFEGVSPEFLAELTRIGFVLNDYSDGEFGTSLTEMHVHLDNLRLNGGLPWDRFEWSGFERVGDGVNINEIGWSNGGFDESNGSLYFAWDVQDESNEASAVVLTTTPQDWSGHTFIQAQLLSVDGVAPFSLTLFDGENRVTTELASVPVAGIWNKMTWEIPTDSSVDLSQIQAIEINATNLEALPAGRVFIDEIVLGKTINAPYNVEVGSNEGINTINWVNPVQSAAETVIVRAAINNFATKAGEGTIICEVPLNGEEGSCQHQAIDPNLNYYYTVITQGGNDEVFAQGASQTIVKENLFLFSVPGGAYQMGIDPINGSIRYMSHNGQVSEFPVEQPLWRVEFQADGDLISLNSTEFSSDSERARFSINGEQNALIYEYRDGPDVLELTVFLQPISQASFDFKVLIENRTDQALRKLVMPMFNFNAEGLQEVITPMYEGVSLLPPFFAENRQTYVERPELFANYVYVNSGERGNMSIYTIQDNFSRSDALASHDPDTPMFQPTNILIGGAGAFGYVQLEVLAEIKPGETWQSATNRVIYNQPLEAGLNRFVEENQLIGVSAFADKGIGFQTYTKMAYSPMIYIDLDAVAEGGFSAGESPWTEVEQNLLDLLPPKSILQFSNWRQGSAAVPSIDGQFISQPAGQTIWFDQYGVPDQFSAMLDRINESGRMTMPSVNWTVADEIDLETGSLITYAELPSALASTRPEIPVLAGEGIVLKPWGDETVSRVNEIINQYQTQYPVELMYFGMEGHDQIQYTFFDDDNTDGTYAAFTQSVIEENNRLAGQIPIITGGLFAPLGKSSIGFSGSLQQHPQEFVHIGDAYVHWHATPLAAQMMHDRVALYPNLEKGFALPNDDAALFTYYTTYGYNLAGTVDPISPNTNNEMGILEAYQSAVNSRTFGRKLVSHRILSEDRTKVETVWGGGIDVISIIGNFDPNDSGQFFPVGSYSIAPNGFLATSFTGDLVAGIFAGFYHGTPLSEGDHWIIAEYGDQITVQQPRGKETELSVERPHTWRIDSLIEIQQVLADGRVIEMDALGLSEGDISFFYAQLNGNVPVESYVISYGDPNFSPWDIAQITAMLNPSSAPASSSSNSGGEQPPAQTVSSESAQNEEAELAISAPLTVTLPTGDSGGETGGDRAGNRTGYRSSR